jgi:transcriptional/translational regulatory protein YebC/TACO1
LQDKGIGIDNTEIIMQPNAPVAYEEAKQKEIDELLELIEEIDDVQGVFTNII